MIETLPFSQIQAATNQFIDDLYQIDNLMINNKLFMVYKDNINADTIQSLLQITETTLDTNGEQKKLKKKVFNILVECLQNIIKHGLLDRETHEQHSLLVIGKSKKHFFIITSNLVKNSMIPALKNRIDIINSLDLLGLKQLYSETIRNTVISEKGGAGLGLIDIARKSGNKIEYEFKTVDGDYSYYTIRSNISITD